MHRLSRSLPLALVAALGLAGCGGAVDDGSSSSTAAPAAPPTSQGASSTGGETTVADATTAASSAASTDAGTATTAATTATGAPAIAHGTDPLDVVIRVTEGGGFVPVQYALKSVPSYTLYGDGTVITPAPQTMQYPGPAIGGLQTFKLDEEQMQALLAKAKAAGYLAGGDRSYGDMGTVGVSDMPTTTLEVTADGTTSTRSAYALGQDGARLKPKVAQARETLRSFIAALPTQGDGGGAYEPTSVSVWIGDGTNLPTDPPQQPVKWPLATPLSQIGAETELGAGYTCAVIEGDDLAKVLAVVEAGANEATPWTSGGKRYQLVLRPNLPDETGCGEGT